MNKRTLLTILSSLLLVLLLAAPALSATVTCPSDCTCLLPDEAKKAGSPGYCNGKQAICGYDSAKNEKYCYEKAVTKTTTTGLSQVVVTRVTKTTTPTTTVTTTRTTVPVTQCPSGCYCMKMEDGKAKGMPYCGGKQVQCGYDQYQNALYCFSPPVTTTGTTIPSTTSTTVLATCPADCSCLETAKADAARYNRCSSTAGACSKDASGMPMYCYVTGKTTTGTSWTTTTATKMPGVSAPIRLPVSMTPTVAPKPTSDEGGFAQINSFFLQFFGSGTVQPVDGSIIACRPGLNACNGQCVDLTENDRYCGTCGNSCWSGSGSNEEHCCGGECMRTNDVQNCGGCGNVCPAGEPCQSGHCMTDGCQPSGSGVASTNCGGSCVDLATDRHNCGICGNTCAEDSSCIGSSCVQMTCRPGTTWCIDRCVELMSDRASCGSCNNRCDPDEICSAGSCAECPAGTCGAGVHCIEEDMQTDENNCGGCRVNCRNSDGCCDGRCTDLQSNNNHCGICSHACSESETCIAGTCLMTPGADIPVTCQIEQSPCGRTCVSLGSDESNCGSCGHSCASGQVCIEGDCLTAGGEDGCGLGQIRCGMECIYPESNRANCGRCGHVCGDWYTCRESTCTPYYSGDDDTVCEEPGLDFCGVGECADLRTDPRNCGACGRECPGGSCRDGSCYDLDNDEENCGSVGNRCPDGQACCGGRCQTDRSDDPDMCGPCGIPCTGTGLGCCYGFCWDIGHDRINCGSCGHVCGDGQSCCNGDCVTLAINGHNCGSCGNDCPWYKPYCVGGECSSWPWAGEVNTP